MCQKVLDNNVQLIIRESIRKLFQKRLEWKKPIEMVTGDTFWTCFGSCWSNRGLSAAWTHVPPSAPTFVRAGVQPVTQGYLRFQWRPLSFGTGMSLYLYVCAEVESTHSSLQWHGTKLSYTGALRHSTAGTVLSMAPRQSSEVQGSGEIPGNWN